MSEGTHVSRADGVLASQVLAPRLGSGFVTPEVLDFYAVQHELRTGQVLRRDYESDEEYQARRAEFRAAYGDAKPRKLSMPPAFARRELENMERNLRRRLKYATGKEDVAPTDPGEKKAWAEQRRAQKRKIAEDFNYMNMLRELLGLPEVDYTKEQPVDVSTELHVAYLTFSQLTETEARIAACAEATDANLMRLVMQFDPNEAVKAAAQSRFAQLCITGG